MILKTEELYALTYSYNINQYDYIDYIETKIFSIDIESAIKYITNEVEDAVEYIYTREEKSKGRIKIDISKVLLKDGVFTSGDKIETKYFDFWGSLITAD